MTCMDPKQLDLAFVRADAPILSDVIGAIEARTDLSLTRRRDLISGLRRVARALGRDPANTPADLKWLQPRLGKVLPAAHGISAKSWANAVSDAKAALTQAGLVTRHASRIEDLAPDWHHLWRLVLDSGDPTLQPALCRFVHFLNRQGLRPDEVSDAHAIAYREALELNEISRSPDTAFRAAVNGWNLASRRLPEWPRQALTLPKRTNHVAIPADALPASFQADLARFIRQLAAPDPLDRDALEAQSLSPASVRLYRGKILRFAGALVQAGVEVESLDSLARLVEPETAELGLRWLLARNEGERSQDIDTIAGLLVRIARDHVRAARKDQRRLAEMARSLKVRSPQGMTSKNRARLRALDDPAALRRLLILPETLEKRARQDPRAYQAALMSEEAVAIGLILYCPLRRKNLCAIHVDRHLQRPGDGRVFLVFEPHEVKNGRRIEFELRTELVRMIDAHVGRRSPTLCPPGTPWLFPRRDGAGPLRPDQLATRVKRRIAREVGVEFNIHLFRHLAAKLFLDANPGAYEVVRQLLGHASLSKTLAAYSGFEAGTATRLFADVLTEARAR